MFDLITIGDATLDTFLVVTDAELKKGKRRSDDRICFRFADKIPIEHAMQSVGGNAANVAVGAVTLGLKAAILTELGDDINGMIIEKELHDAGVDGSLIKQHAGQDSRYSIILNYKSERTIFSWHGKRTYRLPTLPKTKWIYYTSMGPGVEAFQKKLTAYLKKHPDVRLAMNPGSYQMQKISMVKSMLPRTEILFVNKEEAERLVGKTGTARALAKRIKKMGVATVVVTDSTRGSYATDAFGSYVMPTYPIPAIAKTGAGDAYASGFLSAVIQAKETPEAMQWGTANASGVIQAFGAEEGLLNQTGVKKIIRKYPHVKPKKVW